MAARRINTFSFSLPATTGTFPRSRESAATLSYGLAVDKQTTGERRARSAKTENWPQEPALLEVIGSFRQSADSQPEKDKIIQMNGDSGPEALHREASQLERSSPVPPLFRLLIALWMAAVLLIFIGIRILGSNTAMVLMSKWSHR